MNLVYLDSTVNKAFGMGGGGGGFLRTSPLYDAASMTAKYGRYLNVTDMGYGIESGEYPTSRQPDRQTDRHHV